ncbi:MAG TPA: helix-turn-helix domain-containing protein, partial [Candidatus Acidoferrum sp.]|nr:helix-turn-helix domain-containing protein [Candidatus Acidoferrum sp.]
MKPADVQLPDIGRRRVPGLRREEVATLAGVGVTWYTMLESGTAEGASRAMLAAVARALRLDDDETEYLFRLAEEREATAPSDTVADDVAGALAAVEWAPAYIITARWMVLAWNDAMTLVWGIEPPGSAPFNIVRRSFEDPAIRRMHGERFETFAHNLVAMVRAGMSGWLEDPE